MAGCGPAFADLFLEALADGGVACGLPRAAALTFAAQMMLGTAQLALESGAHPGALKDAVCSPGGSTIQGVRTLEKAGFRSAVIEAVIGRLQKKALIWANNGVRPEQWLRPAFCFFSSIQEMLTGPEAKLPALLHSLRMLLRRPPPPQKR